MYTPHTYKKGFTLIETIVAIAVLLLGVTGPLVLSQKGLRVTQLARQETTAFFLIQESMEHVKTLRDTNSLELSPWLSGLSNCTGGNICMIDTTTGDIEECTGTCPVLRYNSDTAEYGYDPAWEATLFTRTIEIEEFSGNTEAAIDVTISWPTTFASQTITIRETIHDFFNAVVTTVIDDEVTVTTPVVLSVSQHEQSLQTNSVSFPHEQEYSEVENKLLLITFAYNNLGSASVTSVEYGGIPATQILFESTPDSQGNDSVLEVWSIPEDDLPTSDTSYTIDIEFDSDIQGGAFGAVMLGNVEEDPDKTGTAKESGFVNGGNEDYDGEFIISIDQADSLLIEIMVGIAFPDCDPDADSDGYCYNGLSHGAEDESPVDEILTFSQFGDDDPTRRFMPDIMMTHAFVGAGSRTTDWLLKPQDGYIYGWLVFENQ